MTEISAAVVKDLREKTGAGMMECKKALTDAGGDVEKAIDILRQKGLASAAKKASRSASQGLITVAASESVSAMSEVNCETDFVAKTDDFKELVADINAYLLATPSAATDDPKIADLVKAKIAKLGENIVFRRFARFDMSGKTGATGSYIHMDKIGVMVEASCEQAAHASSEAMKTLLKDVAMHVAAANPSFLSREKVPQDTLDREKDIYRAQVEGKPANVIDKIVEGKVEKFYSDVCLVDQIFVKDPDGKKKIKDVVAEAGKSLGGNISLESFVRFQLGEGLPSEPKSC
ncbi:MAG: translation elongation factor Ts [Thermodesulfovibrio sp.]|nr:translation elongation factor Ts [Thermodesulfovibrio sp.]